MKIKSRTAQICGLLQVAWPEIIITNKLLLFIFIYSALPQYAPHYVRNLKAVQKYIIDMF